MKSKKVILFIIFAIAFFLRIVDISRVPLYGDELTIVLDSQSLLKNGTDQLGNNLPLTFHMGAGRPPGYVYFSIPFVGLFGSSALGVRGLSIVSGLGVVLLLYYIGKKIFSEKVGLIAAGMGAISIWDLSLSRAGFEAHFALFLALLGFFFFLIAKQKPYFYIISAISFGLTLHTYPTYKLILPLFLILLVWFEGGIKNYLISKGRNYFLVSTFILVLISIVSLSQTFFGGSEERFSRINIFSNQEIKSNIEQKINYERQLSKLPPSLSTIFHNKVIEYGKIFGENYLQNFSLDFLILHGDRGPRHNMATMGEIYIADFILIFIGIFALWRTKKRELIFLLLWLFLAPIPTAIVDLPHALRSAFMLPPLIILSAFGLFVLIESKRKIILYLLAAIFIIQFSFFIQKLYYLAPAEYASFWSQQAKTASETVVREKNNYDYIFLSDRIDNIEFAYPVYAKVKVSDIQQQNKQKNKLGTYHFKKFENIYIGSLPEGDLDNFIKDLSGKILYVGIDNSNKLVFLNKGI